MKKKTEMTVLDSRRLTGEIWSLELAFAPEDIPEKILPGQFAGLYPAAGDLLLMRPISICRWDGEKGALRFVYRAAGKGTRTFTDLRKGDRIDMLGILGNGYDLSALQGKRVLLLGGGIGIPPMLELAARLSGDREGTGTEVTAALGYRDSSFFLREEMERYAGDPLLTFTLSPHAPYTCSSGYLKKIAAEAAKRDLILHYHLSESDGEVQGIKEQHGMTPIAHADSLGLLDQPIILAHCVKAETEDMPLLAKPMVSVVSNPASNMKLGNGFAPIPQMLKAGVNVCLGTDGPASNNALNLFRDMTIFALIHKGVTQEPTELSAQTALASVTVNAAKAIGREHELGQVKAGYLADLSILDLNAPELLPANDIVSSLVYSAYGTEVETVMVHGRIVMENRELKTIDEDRLRYEIRKRTGIFL